MKKIAVYPGSFDPITYGHIDLIKRAAAIFDQLIVAVVSNPQKKTLFNIEEREAMLKKATRDIPNVVIDDFSGLLIDYVRQKKARVIIRGLRAISDFEFEFQMALTNQRLAEDIETFFLTSNEKYAYFSSGIIKEIVKLGANVKYFVPLFVEKELNRKLKGK